MRPLALLGLLLFALPSAAYSQANLRAWNEDGQTWLVWQDTAPLTGLESYELYRASAPITDVTTAMRMGRIYPQDGRGTRLKLAQPTATWSVPDGLPGAAHYVLASNEQLFVYTPHVLTSEHFAVVKAGDTIPLATCAVGPITQGAGQIRPHAQVTGVDGGHPYTVYSLWVDGGTDPEAGIPGFPMMANATSAGIGHLFAVFEPTTGLPPAPMPAVLFLHGGDGSYWNYRPSTSGQHQINLHVESGLYVTLDDNLFIRLGSAVSSSVANRNTRWFGYCSQFDRFQPSNLLPANDEIVVNFTQRRISWVMDWLASARGVDPHRIALAGLSLGGHGTGEFCRVYPEKVSAALAFVMPVIPGEEPFGYAEWGKLSQQLATNLGVTYPEFYYPTTKFSPLDFPFARFVDGTADAVVPWFTKPTVYGELNSLRWGTAIYWDGRGHTAAAGWTGQQFVLSPRHSMEWLTRYRNDRSFPAFHDVDHNLVLVGNQPDPGDAVQPSNGDPAGTWGGHFDWDSSTVTDTEGAWSAEMQLVLASPFAGDNAPTPAARASVTLRRLQQFSASPFEPLPWTLTNASSGALLTSGTAYGDSQGVVTIQGLPFGPQPVRLEVRHAVEHYGSPSRGCAGAPTISAMGQPAIGSTGFYFEGTNVPALSFGAFAASAAPSSLPIAGITLLCDPGQIVASANLGADSSGYYFLMTGIPPVPALTGTSVYCQTLWIDPCGVAGLSSSDGLRVTIVP